MIPKTWYMISRIACFTSGSANEFLIALMFCSETQKMESLKMSLWLFCEKIYAYELLHLFESKSSLCQNFVFGRESWLGGGGKVGTGRARGAVVCVTDNRILNSRGKTVGCRWRAFKVDTQFDHVSVECIIFENSVAVADSVGFQCMKSLDDVLGSIRIEESNVNGSLQSVLSCQMISGNVLPLENERFCWVKKKYLIKKIS